jgi:hypothetical protein
MSDPRTPESAAEEAAKASDIEQRSGHGGNLRDGGAGAEEPMPRPVVGSSAHIPRREEVAPLAADDRTASPGADADRNAAR